MIIRTDYFKRGLVLAFFLLLCGMFADEQILSEKEGMPAPGVVVKELYDKDLDVHQYVLSNNVRVNLKSMPVCENTLNRISFRASFGRGELETPNQQAALPFVTDLFLMKGGVQPGFANNTMDECLAEKIRLLNFSVDLDDFSFTGSISNKKGLESPLKLMCAYFTSPIYQDDTLNAVHHTLDQIYGSLHKTPQGVCKDKVKKLLANGDWRFGYPPKNEAMAITVDQIRSFLEKPLKDSYLELSIVGNFVVEECLNTVLETIGRLPMREDSRPYLKELRNVEFPQTPLKETFFIEDDRHPTAFIMIAWPTVDRWNWYKTIQLKMLAEIFSIRLDYLLNGTIGPYNPRVKSTPSLEYNHYGHLEVFSHINPKQAEEIQQFFLETSINLRHGITEEEFKKAMHRMFEEIERHERDVDYWLNTIDRSHEFPIFLKWEKSLKETCRNLKREEMEAVAKEFLHPQKAAKIIILPPVKEHYY